jgi:hypothetical protein
LRVRRLLLSGARVSKQKVGLFLVYRRKESVNMMVKFVRCAFVVLAVVAMLFAATEVNAACCGGGGGYATTAFYPQAYSSNYAGSYSAYYPTTAYQTTGWYPGYYWDRVRTRLWGSPRTYVAAYPSTAYVASYAPTYTASYAPIYSASYAPMHSAGYATSYAAPSTCSTCTAGYAPSCSTCTQQVTMRPVCDTCTTCSTCDPCSGCSTCSSGVVQTSYQQSTGCSTCNGTVQQQSTVVTQQQPQPDPVPPQTFNSGSDSTSTDYNAAPNIDPNASVPIQREEQRPVTNGSTEGAQPAPGDDSTEHDPYHTGDSESSTFLQPPKLFDPNDRTAKRSIAPVTTALYQKQVSYRNVSIGPVTAQQVQQDAVGWTSASN